MIEGSRDGQGCGDCDQPYRFGQRPRAIAPWPFTERQYARLLILRGRIRERLSTVEEHPDATEQS